MNHCGFQQNAFVAEMRSALSFSNSEDSVVCPKPRRLGVLNHSFGDPVRVRPFTWRSSHEAEVCDSKAGTELMDIILTEGVYNIEQADMQVVSSPPFFCGSPPSRASNPLIQDARFGAEEVTPISPFTIPVLSGLPSSPSSARKGGCNPMKFGDKPAAVRIEGFDCLDRARRNRSIPAMA